MYPLALALLACTADPTHTAQPAAAAAAGPIALRTASPSAVKHRPTVELTGSLEPIASVQLGFDVPGRMVELMVARGTMVREGQAIARLDAELARAQLAQAQAAVAGAEAQAAQGEAAWGRAQKLKEAGALSEQAYGEAEAGIKAARAGVEQARAAARMAATHLDKHTLRAPIAGMVTNGPDNAGMMIGAGTPLFVIEDLSALQLKATAPESASWIREGQPATILGGAPGVEGASSAVVARVIPSLDPATRRIPVEIRLGSADAGLRAHAFGRVRLEAMTEVDAWSVPRAALVARPDFSVFVDGPQVRRIPLTILAEEGANAIVTGALAASDAVVLDPPITLGVE